MQVPRSDSGDEVEEEEIETVKIDSTKLSPLSPEVTSKQATINLGTIGHVAHGKLTVVKAISGVMTVRFKNELVRNITVKPGYANAKMNKCENKAYLGQGCYRSYHSDKEDRLPCEDASIIWSCFAPDFEHLAAVESMKLQNITILQNKVGLVKEAQALEHQKSIASFVKGTVAEAPLIVPISAQLKYNIDVVNEYVMKRIPIPVWDFMSSPWLVVIHSFDVNKFGTEVNERMGGVTHGSILAGVLALEMRIEIYLGIVTKDQQGCKRYRPIFSCIITLLAENNQLQFAVPSGLGVGTLIDLMLCRADRLVGQVLSAVSKLSQIYTELETSLFLLQRLLDIKTEDKRTSRASRIPTRSTTPDSALAPPARRMQLTQDFHRGGTGGLGGGGRAAAVLQHLR
ncbi:translation initiation factor eIF2 gamma subunit [Phellopilus nigrolimitatus]|nr:translation initiation factor eIF2 gamma subunit [Phellopilus nigrolimitatus]